MFIKMLSPGKRAVSAAKKKLQDTEKSHLTTSTASKELLSQRDSLHLLMHCDRPLYISVYYRINSERMWEEEEVQLRHEVQRPNREGFCVCGSLKNIHTGHALVSTESACYTLFSFCYRNENDYYYVN